jgi:hypothetical protein
MLNRHNHGHQDQLQSVIHQLPILQALFLIFSNEIGNLQLYIDCPKQLALEKNIEAFIFIFKLHSKLNLKF